MNIKDTEMFKVPEDFFDKHFQNIIQNKDLYKKRRKAEKIRLVQFSTMVLLIVLPLFWFLYSPSFDSVIPKDENSVAFEQMNYQEYINTFSYEHDFIDSDL